MTIKHGHQTTGNMRVIWSDESSFMPFPTSERIYVWRTAKQAYNPECLVPLVKNGGGSVMVRAAILYYSVGPIITLHGQITSREYMDRLGNLVLLIILMLFPNNDVFFRKRQCPNSHSWNCSVMV
jgi:hypothetical protein